MVIFSPRVMRGLKLMVLLGQRYPTKLIPLKDISEELGESLKNMEKTVSPLSRAGYVLAIQGVHGGYRLSAPPENYTIGDIIRILDGAVVPVKYLRNEHISDNDLDFMTDYWIEFTKVIYEFLDKCTLQDLIDKKKQYQ